MSFSASSASMRIVFWQMYGASTATCPPTARRTMPMAAWAASDAVAVITHPQQRAWGEFGPAAALRGFLLLRLNPEPSLGDTVPILAHDPALSAARRVAAMGALCRAACEDMSARGVLTISARYPPGRAVLRALFTAWAGTWLHEAVDPADSRLLLISADVPELLSILQARFP